MRIFNSRAAIIKNIISIMSIVFCFAYIFLIWNEIPARVPGHFDAAGNITSWSEKGTVWLLPLIMLALFVLMTAAGKFPSMMNTGVKITEENKERLYPILKGMADTIKLIICLMFTVISISIAAASALPVWFLAVSVAAVLGSTAVYCIILRKAR
ncbi:MAG: DUF1648 domain-containing protein [Eubacteriaceae bacterium]|jgi:uncharacterized membrane protein|nr:DUF1648 domain-containing protein [Eubacteriaceae bacterium]